MAKEEYSEVPFIKKGQNEIPQHPKFCCFCIPFIKNAFLCSNSLSQKFPLRIIYFNILWNVYTAKNPFKSFLSYNDVSYNVCLEKISDQLLCTKG